MNRNSDQANSVQLANTKTLMTWACLTVTLFFLISISPWVWPSLPGASVSPFVVVIAALNTAVFLWRRVRAGHALSCKRPRQAFRIPPSSNAVEPERKITTLSWILIALFATAMLAGKGGVLPVPAGLASIIVPLVLITPLLDVFGSKAGAWQKFLNGENPD